MKFLLATLISLFSLVGTTSHATDNINVSAVVMATFQSSFKDASEVTWKITDNYSKADFVSNSQHISAFFDNSGSLIAVSRNLSSFQLPISLQTKLRDAYGAYWISDLFELSDDNGTTYYVTVESGDSKITLKSNGTSEWSTYQKLRKS